MTDRRSLFTSAGLTAIAIGTGTGVAGCQAAPSAGPSATAVTVKTSDVPVGGGKILTDGKYVVTQPTAGTFKAFSKTCTHQGCPVTAIEGEAIVCRCHGARFSIVDGSVTNGPATKPLTPATVSVSGDSLTIG